MRTTQPCNYYLFCELNAGAQDPDYQNVTYRVPNNAQLGYGALRPNPATGALVRHNLARLNIPAGAPANYAGFAGGNNFNNLVDRAPGIVANVGGVAVHVIHAPSSHNGFEGQRALSYLTCHFEAAAAAPGGGQWMVLGDLNVQPNQLTASPAGFGLMMVNYIDYPDGDTYFGRLHNAQLDYAVSSAALAVQVAVARRSPRDSDHRPILVTW